MLKLWLGFRDLFPNRSEAFVAADLFWYPVEGHPEIRTAPDTLVAIGRPKGDRGSYMQWREEGIAPQIVVELLSPLSQDSKMLEKRLFYERYGVQEYYVYDPEQVALEVWIREGESLRRVPRVDGWISPLAGIRFDLSSSDEMIIWHPDGQRFLNAQEWLGARRQAEDADRQLADAAHERAERLAEQLRRLGVEPKA